MKKMYAVSVKNSAGTLTQISVLAEHQTNHPSDASDHCCHSGRIGQRGRRIRSSYRGLWRYCDIGLKLMLAFSGHSPAVRLGQSEQPYIPMQVNASGGLGPARMPAAVRVQPGMIRWLFRGAVVFTANFGEAAETGAPAPAWLEVVRSLSHQNERAAQAARSFWVYAFRGRPCHLSSVVCQIAAVFLPNIVCCFPMSHS